MSKRPSAIAAFAIAAHPDDIEFCMAGTLLLLKQHGCQIHCMTLASGNCGSTTMSPAKTRSVRRQESIAAAKILGATHHPSICDDLEIAYTLPLLRKLAATIRQVQPAIILTHSPQDYMEDHMATARLAVTAAFSRAMPNFHTAPRRKPITNDITIYHAMPHGLRGPLNESIIPELFIDTATTHPTKRRALAAHASQKAWLDTSQGMDSYLGAMDDISHALGRLSGKYEHAEAWRRHNPLGLCAPDADPLREHLATYYLSNQDYQPGRTSSRESQL